MFNEMENAVCLNEHIFCRLLILQFGYIFSHLFAIKRLPLWGAYFTQTL